MKQWLVLFKKETVEMMRNYKWVWIPLVFAVFGLMQPISSYYMPDLMENFGDLPEGTVIEIPIPPPGAVMNSALAQFTQMGVLVLVLSSMGAVSSERTAGTAGLILAKPVSKTSFITAKWTAAVLVAWLALILGFAAAWYYTELLIGPVEAGPAISSFFVYGLFLTFVVTVTIFLSTLMKNSLGIAFLSIGVVLALSILSSVLKSLLFWSPGTLTGHAGSLLETGEAGDHFVLAVTMSIIVIASLLFLAPTLFKRQKRV
ncbi:ABC transporter permease [Bacillus marinisedimentorum]|uniref:ABC transporter permease n=1 Tax=Bacillus marinisedimentorum TaxID=1821260 RepID=UPI000871BBA4|nr:ABC transporter permease subunit [Bacillus marinisedimentorum]